MCWRESVHRILKQLVMLPKFVRPGIEWLCFGAFAGEVFDMVTLP